MNEPDPALLSLNTATVRQQWTLPQIIDGCARHGIRGISPWRDQVAAAGLKESRCASATPGSRHRLLPRRDVSGDRSRRPARGAGRQPAAVDEALTLGAACLILVGRRPAEKRDGKIESKDLAGAREMVRDGIGELLG
jgi:hypothetical protein